jgi:uncharacterized protein YndB with AHSA1/START domain
MTGIVATVETDIEAPPEQVWAALTEPEQVKQYFFGTQLATDWRPGSPITWSGEYNGQQYEDKGEVIAVDRPRRLEHTHFSPMTGAEDRPENYHRVVWTLQASDSGTHVTVAQDNNADDEAAQHTEQNWRTVLDGLKKHVEAASR